MPPRARGGRGGPAATGAGGRTSSRIAEKQEAAHQAEREAADAAATAPPESSMPPPSSRGRGRGRPPRGNAENHARRGTTRRGSRGGSSIASFSPAVRDTPTTSDVYALQHNDEPFTPQRADAAHMVYGGSWREAVELTPRTRDATANLMNKFVDRLNSVSKDLLTHLAIEGEERDESWIHELRTHKDVFNTFYKIYTRDADVFIDIDAVSERSSAHNVPVLWERMTKGVAIANLANLLSDVEDLDGDPSNVLNRLPLLQRIDDTFPVFFVPGGRKNMDDAQDWIMDDNTIQQAFNIRTQRFIETLRGVQQASPLRLFARVFLDMEVGSLTDDMLGKFIEGAGYKSFAAFDINGPNAQTYRDTINNFRNMLAEMDTNALISKLEEDYSFDLLLKDLKDWVKSCENKISGPPQPALGFSGDSVYSADAQLQAEARASQHGRFALSGVERLRQHIGAGSASQQAQDSPRLPSESPLSHNFDDASVAGTDAEMLARAREVAGQAPYFMSSADGAMYAAAAASAAVDGGKRGGGRKRGRKSAGDDPDAKRARAADSAAMPPPPPPLAGPLGPLPAGPATFDPVALSRRSQLISKANRRPAQPKQRRPWTAHDTQQLVLAVDLYKAKWSTIEKAIREGHVAFNVPERDQQGLRDKARLVKVDILKTDIQLPPSFDLVVLGRKEKDMVIAAGRNPDRREEDVDGVGNPTNIFYDAGAPALVQQNIPAEPQVLEDGLPRDPDAIELRPLQEAHMVADAPVGGAPDAPMMAAEMGDPVAPPSESLGEAESVVDPVDAPPIDPNMSEAAPSSAAVPV